VLHRAVREELETFLCELEQSGARPLPRYVLDVLRGYLRCGVLAAGFTRLRCDGCGHDLLVATERSSASRAQCYGAVPTVSEK
jgi:hypothetical protein